MYPFQSYFLDKPLVKGRIFDVFEPAEGVPVKDVAIFFVHGGGWHSGSRAGFYEIMEAFGHLGYITCTTDYRLTANGFEQLADIRESFDCFVEILKKRNHSCRIAVHGSSAGAHLASLLCCAKPGECGEKVEKLKYPEVRPEMAFFQATPHNFKHWEGMMPPFWNQMQSVAGVKYDENPEPYERLSMENFIREDNPKIFFMEAELEHLFPSEHTLEIAKKHRAMNIASQWKVYAKVEHGFFYELKRKMQLEAFDDICKFLEGELHTEF